MKAPLILVFLSVTLLLSATFSSVTEEAFPSPPAGAWSVAWIDINNNSLQDAFVAPYYFYLNNGDGTFTPRTTEEFLPFNIGSDTRVSFADANNNGYVDIVICEHIHTTPTRERYVFYFENSGPPNYTFSGQIIYTLPLNVKGGQPMFVDATGDGKMEIYVALFGNWQPDHGIGADRLFAQNSSGGWNDVTLTHIPQLGNPAYKRPSRGINACDFDMDFDIDIFVPVYVISPSPAINMLWVNDGNGNFTDRAAEAGVDIEPHGRYGIGLASGAAFGDFNNNGWFDLVVANIHGWAAVYENNKDGTFTNITEETGLFTFYDGEKQWHNANWIDHNNNGYLDLWLTQWYGEQGYVCYVFENQGSENPGFFLDVTEQLGFNKNQEFNEVMGLAAGDYTGNGFMDVLFYTSAGWNTQYRGVHLYKNNGNDNNWLQIDLVGNGETIGLTPVGCQARVFYKDGTASYIRQVETASSDQSMHQHRLHFGLGKQEEIQQIMVRWLDERVEYWQGEEIGEINRTISLTYGTGSTESTVLFVDSEFFDTPDGTSYKPYNSIQQAIDTADDGFVVSVAPGYYMENVNFNGKNIKLIATSKTEETILMASTGGRSSVVFNSGETNDAVLDGFIFSNGWGQNEFGGAITINNSSPTIRNCIFNLNNSNQKGGAIRINDSEARIIDCHFESNESGIGGAIYSENSELEINRSTFQSNRAQNGSAISGYSTGLKLVNSLLTDNVASESGVVFLSQGTLTMDFCTITANSSGLVLEGNPTPVNRKLTNSIIYNNGSFDIEYDVEPNVSYSNTSELITGEGNISANPKFAFPENNDWRLSDFSPCIGAGNLTTTDVDLLGNPRPQPDGSSPDIGCYENARSYPAPGILFVATTGSNTEGNGAEDNPYQTINHALQNSLGGETIVLAPGTYEEHITFEGKNSRIVSLYESTGNPEYIETTIIRGTDNNPVIRFQNGESSQAGLKGLTITNGTFSNGGGIRIMNANPTLSNLRITENSATTNGGGIFIQNGNPVLRDLIISGNSANNYGGGLMIVGGQPIIDRLDIHQNSANNNAAGFATLNSTVIARNLTIADNSTIGSTPRSGGVLSVNSQLYLINSILWNNSPEQTATLNNGTLNIFYSNVQDGFTGEGNIDSDPLFIDSQQGDYRLDAHSPCRDAGIAYFSYESFELINLQPGSYGGSAPDMGAYDYVLTDVETLVIPKTELSLSASPNPFNPSTLISFSLPEEGVTSLRIYNIKGRLVKELLNKHLTIGNHQEVWEGRNEQNRLLPSGVYLVRLSSSTTSATTKIMLLK